MCRRSKGRFHSRRASEGPLATARRVRDARPLSVEKAALSCGQRSFPDIADAAGASITVCSGAVVLIHSGRRRMVDALASPVLDLQERAGVVTVAPAHNIESAAGIDGQSVEHGR